MRRRLFWTAYTTTLVAWLLVGIGVASALVGQCSMPAAAQLALCGGQCQPNQGSCTTDCTTMGDCTGSSTIYCQQNGDPCDVQSCDTGGTSMNDICNQDKNASGFCAYSASTSKCYDTTDCVCNWNAGSGMWECKNGDKDPEDEIVCIAGAPGSPHGK